MNKHKHSNAKKILFANFSGDGHFNPLTGLAVHLANAGYDVRWYSSKEYAPKLRKLGIPHFPFIKALEFSADDIDTAFPERKNARSKIAKLKFDILNIFIERGPEYYEDLTSIYKSFPFDLLIADCAFTGIPFVKHLLKVPVISVGVFPLTETSKDLAPAGLGVEPSYTMAGKMKMSLLRAVSKHILFKQSDKVLHRMLDDYNIPHNKETVFDMLIKQSDVFLQSGTPSFEYKRSDMSTHIKYIGALLPHTIPAQQQWYNKRLEEYSKVVLLTQGTVERDVNKLIVPTLEALKDTDTLVICTTGGSQTAILRERYQSGNIIIEDFIPFADVMPYADAYITNGGYGGVMLGIQNRLPLIVAGLHEGKNEICARIGFFKYGINLKTETPQPSQIKAAVDIIFSDNTYRNNVNKLANEFSLYNPNMLTEKYVNSLMHTGSIKKNGSAYSISSN